MYNEYKARDNKVLLNIKNFSIGNIIISKEDISSFLFEVDKDVAENIINKYNIETKEINFKIDNTINERHKNGESLKDLYNIIEDNQSIMIMSDNTDNDTDNLITLKNEKNNIRNKYISELLFNNTTSKQNIQIIIHE